MSVLDDYQNAIVSKIQAAIPTLLEVEPHYGTFNVAEVARRIVQSPSAFVAIPTLRPGSVYSDGRITFLAEVMIVIISADVGPPPDGDRAVICRRVMEQVLQLAMWNCFGSPVMPPTEIEGNELHYDKLDPQGLAMCVASWTQEILVTPDDPFFSKEQSRMADFSFPNLNPSAPDLVTTNESAETGQLDLQGLFDKGVIR